MKLVIQYSVAVCFLTCVVQTTATHAQSYLTPYGGYQSKYDASTQLRPDQQAGTTAAPRWANDGYGESTARVQREHETGQWKLSLDNTAGTSPANFAHYGLDSGTGSGTNEDFITVDFRFQLTSPSWLSPQFMLGITRPPTAAQKARGESEHSYDLDFSQIGIRRINSCGVMIDASDVTTDTFQGIFNTWHDARLVINTRLADARLYLDGRTTPTVSFHGGAKSGSSSRNGMMFGDGSASVRGGANIAYLRWTNNSMAIPLVGGQVNFLKTTVITTNDKNLCLSTAHQFADGTISVIHCVGEYMQDMTWPFEISRDKGQTWKTMPPGTGLPGIGGSINGANLPDGSTVSVGWSDTNASPHKVWSLTTYKWASSKSKPTETRSTVTFPFEVAGLLAHRSLVVLNNGNWVLTSNGTTKAIASESSAYLIGSSDQGKTWKFLSIIGGGAGPAGGYNEPYLIKLADGSLLALVRTASDYINGPLVQTKSTDGGLTWTKPVQIDDHGVDPCIVRIHSGALVASYGRPGVYLMVDFSGTGDHWQKIPMYCGYGSGYSTLVKLKPNLVGIIYDESGFVGTHLAPEMMPNRLVMTSMYIQAAP